MNRQAALAIVIVASYVLARYCVYAMFSVYVPGAGFSWERWFIRDIYMSIPRLAALGLCLAVMRTNGGIGQWAWHWRLQPLSGALVAGLTASDILRWAGESRAARFSSMQIGVGWITTLPVAFFEEFCFRGLLFTALRDRLGARGAAFASSALFAVYHVQAQGLTEWPKIFVFGIGACAALHRGAGLPWLILSHELIDGAWFHFGSDGALRPASPWLYWAGLALLIATAAVGWAAMNPSETPPSKVAAQAGLP